MNENMIRLLLPMALSGMKLQPVAEKKRYAELLRSILSAYIEDRRADLDKLLRDVGFSDPLRRQLMETLWYEQPTR